MMNKEQIETLLRANGAAPTSSDEEIRSILLSARYQEDDVDTAIMVLRENVKTNKTRVEGLHKVFRTNQALAPQEISQLLGIDYDIEAITEAHPKSRELSKTHYIITFVAAVVISMSAILLYMYLFRVGVFYPTA